VGGGGYGAGWGAAGLATGVGLGAYANSNWAGSYTRPWAANALYNQGYWLRDNFGHYDCFHDDWWGRYPGAWRAAAWTGAAVWAASTWDDCYAFCSYPAQPVYYDYGTNVVYQGDTVYVDGNSIGTQEQYMEQAVVIADTGKQAEASKEAEWLPLGVFAMVQGERTDSNDVFQLAVNKAGTIRGNFYQALTDSTLPVYGSVDKTTQRAAWTVGDQKQPIYEAGFANLTKAETTMMVHFGKDRSQQWTLIRIEQPAQGK
jgi:hypothetical protein